MLRYDVRSPFELVNNTPEQDMLFKGGSPPGHPVGHGFRGGPETPDAGGRATSACWLRGAIGEPLAVYRQKEAGFAGQPTVFTSPTGRESIRIGSRSRDDVKLQYEKTDGGFQAVVHLPLARLGLR